MGDLVLSATSKDSIRYFPNNQIADFRSRVDLPLDPAYNYEVALNSISYCKSWHNVRRDGDYWMEYYSSDEPSITTRASVAPGHYARRDFALTVQHLVGGEHAKVKASDKISTVTLSYDDIFHRFKITFKKVPHGRSSTALSTETRLRMSRGEVDFDRVIMSRDMAELTGFVGNSEADIRETDGTVHLFWENQNQTKEYWASDKDGFDRISYFWLQTDLVQPEHNLGGDRYPVLGLIPVQNDAAYGQRCQHEPKNSIWLPLSRFCKQAHFVLIDEHGEKVAFEFGTLALTLVVRRSGKRT